MSFLRSIALCLAAAAASVAADGLEINGDAYASEDYRRQLIKVLTRRALESAMSR